MTWRQMRKLFAPLFLLFFHILWHFYLFLDSPLRHWVRNEDICPRFTCSVPFGGSRWENHSNLFVASTDGRWQNGTLRPQSRRSHLKSLVFINKVIIAFFPIALILYIDGPEIINLKVYLSNATLEFLDFSMRVCWKASVMEVKIAHKFSCNHKIVLNLTVAKFIQNYLKILK